jgi:hypothetical protein
MTQSPDAAEELSRLLAAGQDWARRNLGPEIGRFGAASECQWCPVCQLMAALRGERPELTAQVAEAGAALLTALRGLLEAAGNSAPEPPSRVQHIDLGGV